MTAGGLFASAGRWWTLTRLLYGAGRPLAAGAVAFNVLLGLLPVAFAVSTSVVLGDLPTGTADPAGWSRPLVVGLAGAVASFTLHQILTPFQAAVGETVARAVDGRCAEVLMTTVLERAPLATAEAAEADGLLADARDGLARTPPTPGHAVAGLLALVARYSQLSVSVALLSAVLNPPAGLIAGCTAVAIRFGRRGSSRALGLVWTRLTPLRQRVTYLRTAGISPRSAKEFRMLGMFDWYRERHRRDSRAYLAPLWAGRRAAMFWPFIGYTVIGLAGFAVVLHQLTVSAVDGGTDVLSFSLALQTALMCFRFGTHFPESDDQTQFGLQAYDALRELARRAEWDRAVETPAPTAARPRDTPRPAVLPARSVIAFEDVEFAYPGRNRLVLDGLNLELPAGTSTAIVGLNGAGKTTLIKLLARLYEPTGGRITVDGTDLRDLSPQEWQRRLAVIFQDFVRYELSARMNVALGAPGLLADEPALLAAVERAGAANAVRALPYGLDTPLSRQYAEGVDLSGGQWQRLALARAFGAVGQGASVLILDEPTAELDVRAEAAFHDEFLDLTAGLTTVVISHRFSTVRQAHRIAVIDGGRVAEYGSHTDLLEGDGTYAKLFRLQSDRFRLTDGATGGEPCAN
ncbi:ABC transporter ATP-binding protein [Streptomyces sp. NPDC090106]|uniref:ABC transporter ATP-binding protein n=1 Tax=Streptomyces sp. NPDC090106 TaxID=3365946 RepID=UPI0037FEE3E5